MCGCNKGKVRRPATTRQTTTVAKTATNRQQLAMQSTVKSPSTKMSRTKV